MAGIGIVTNPNSRRNRQNPERMRRLAYILGQDDVYELTNQVEDVRGVAEDFKQNGIDVLALNGGDGTNHVTLTTFIEVYGDTPLPKIAFLRGGTMNTISNAVGVKGKPGRILLNLVESYYTGQDFDITERDMLKITDGDTTRYGFIFGNGLISNFLEVYYEDDNPSPWVAAKTLARAVANAPFGGEIIKHLFRPFEAEIELDDETIPKREYTALGISTIEQIGLGFRPFIYCEEQPHRFHMAMVRGDAPVVVQYLPLVRLGKPIPPEVIDNASASRIELRAEEEFVYTIDGDMHHCKSGDLLIESGPRLQIILN